MPTIVNRYKAAAPIDAVWDVYTNARLWPEWSKEIRTARLPGGLVPGQRGSVTFRGLPPARFWITGVEHPRRFLLWTDFRVAHVVFDHRLAPRGGYTDVEETMHFRGPLGWLLWLVKLPTVRKRWPESMARMAMMAARHAGATPARPPARRAPSPSAVG